MRQESKTTRSRARFITIGGPIYIWGWILVAISASIQFATGLLHDIGPTALHAWTFTIPLILFAFAHGSVIYGFRSMIVFAAICIVVTNVVEHVNILTGFPGGSYHYTDSPGPKLLLVPLLAGPLILGSVSCLDDVAADVGRCEPRLVPPNDVPSAVDRQFSYGCAEPVV